MSALRPTPQPRRGTPALALLAALAACGDAGEQGPQRPWPPGTVLTIAGRPVGAEALEPLAEALLELEPSSSLTHRRRLALLNVAIPLECGRALSGESRREEALRGAREFARATADPDPLRRVQDGDERLERYEQDFLGLGLPLWHGVRALEVGTWSGVLEVPGAFAVAKLLARHDALRGVERRFVLLVARFPYVEVPARIDQEAARARVVAVDPQWEPVVPGLLRHREGTGISPLEGS